MLCVSLDVRIYATVGRFAVTAFPNKTRYFAFSLNGYESWGFPCSLTLAGLRCPPAGRREF